MVISPNVRVVITGIGAFTPLGQNVEETHRALLEGKNAVCEVTSFDTADFAIKIAAEIDFDPLVYFNKRDARRLDRLAQLGVIAGREAFAQAGLETLPENLRHMMIAVMGVGVVGFHTAEREIAVLLTEGPGKVSPHAVVMFEPDAVVGELCRRLGIRGASYTVNSACASGLDAFINAYEKILLGRANVAITGGVGAEVTPFGLSSFGQMRALSKNNSDPAHASRPFSRERDGFVLGEGAVVFVLESLESAQRRGVPILAEVVGCGQRTDTYHPTEPDPEASVAVSAIRAALAEAQMLPEEVDLISAHGTSTPYNDRMEAAAIRAVFGNVEGRPLVNATKSMTGHLIAAAGPLGVLAVAQAIQTGWVHPTRNLLIPDEECELNHVIGTALEREINVGLINAFGFQGHNTVVVLKHFVA